MKLSLSRGDLLDYMNLSADGTQHPVHHGFLLPLPAGGVPPFRVLSGAAEHQRKHQQDPKHKTESESSSHLFLLLSFDSVFLRDSIVQHVKSQ